jgi:hypothetical protein
MYNGLILPRRSPIQLLTGLDVASPCKPVALFYLCWMQLIGGVDSTESIKFRLILFHLSEPSKAVKSWNYMKHLVVGKSLAQLSPWIASRFSALIDQSFFVGDCLRLAHYLQRYAHQRTAQRLLQQLRWCHSVLPTYIAYLGVQLGFRYYPPTLHLIHIIARDSWQRLNRLQTFDW